MLFQVELRAELTMTAAVEQLPVGLTMGYVVQGITATQQDNVLQEPAQTPAQL